MKTTTTEKQHTRRGSQTWKIEHHTTLKHESQNCPFTSSTKGYKTVRGNRNYVYRNCKISLFLFFFSLLYIYIYIFFFFIDF